MNEFNINLVGKEENIKKEEILNNFDFNYLPMNNLPISYFPFNNPQLSNELNDKDIDKISGIRNEDFDFDSNHIDYINTNASTGYSLKSFDSYKLYIYKSGTNTLTLKKGIICDILVVGGGGSGGWYGGGGGGGGVVFKPNIPLDLGTYTITIGEGGIYWEGGRQGGNTTISFKDNIFLAAGGGGNGQSAGYSDEPINGSIVNFQDESNSGGGGGASDNRQNGIGNGKSGNGGTSLSEDSYSAGGGGGAGSAGGDGISNKNGDGGSGIKNSITGKDEFYGGGGGGAWNVRTKGNRGIGGIGGGGNGSHYNNGPGVNGIANTGGGGGGTSMPGNGFGGSGIVIIRVKDDSLDTTKKILTLTTNNGINITQDINVDLLLVGGGGGGAGGGKITKVDKEEYLYMGGSGGGGEVIYLPNYKLQKGIYAINIGTGGAGGAGGAINKNSGEDGDDGEDTYLMKDNNIFLTSRGGNKGNGGSMTNNLRFLGGASRKSSYGKGADGNIKNDNYKLGESINIEGNYKYYGNGGVNALKTQLSGNEYRLNNGGYGGKGGNSGISSGLNGSQGSAGIFILKYKNNDIKFIKKNNNIINKNKYIDINDAVNTSLIKEDDTTNTDYKLLIYNSTGKLKVNFKINCDILLVGGGGGGGYIGGGGGGGDVVEKINYKLNAGIYDITIGIGGTGGTSSTKQGGNGNNTTISFSDTSSSYILGASGGGGGGSLGIVPDLLAITYGNNEKSSGGYGGSAINVDYNVIISDLSRPLEEVGKKNTISSSGGNSILNIQSSIIKLLNGGGGGSKDNGGNGNLEKQVGGNGGDGDKSIIKNIYYGGGGGGGGNFNSLLKSSKGGLGGGGISGYITTKDGSINTGGGGGGGCGGSDDLYKNGGYGGSGIVIIRVKKEDIEEGLTKGELYKKIDKDTRIIDDIKNEFNKKLKGFYNNDIPYNKFSIYPLVILIIIFWIFIFLFLLKFVHHYFANIYLYILIFIIIFLLLFGSLWFLYSNNDL
jgi:hypothetical protein